MNNQGTVGKTALTESVEGGAPHLSELSTDSVFFLNIFCMK